MWTAVLTAIVVGGVVVLVRRLSAAPAPALLAPVDAEGMSRAYFPSPNNSGKRSKPPTLIVLHDTEGTETAAATAAYFMNPAAKAAAHITVDGSGATYRSVEDSSVAWHANAVNPYSLGIEMAAPKGAYAWSRAEWLRHERLLETAAERVAQWCRRWNLPVKFVDAEGLKAGRKGITTHEAVTKAFGASDHMDPGSRFPMEDFLRRVARHLAAIPRLVA